ncbi:hypothetical protein OEM_p100910 (plasmid) [Mycobacterium intracellulare subsp. yongonense 05-1390]|nr:hypothetical protein OEM_p100910 [Mycobacterium intracellulare subsp. yongonense 05-1390]
MMTIHEAFTSIHEAGLLDHLSREPRRPAGPAEPASAANNVTHHRHGASTGAFTGLIPSCLRPRVQAAEHHSPNPGPSHT